MAARRRGEVGQIRESEIDVSVEGMSAVESGGALVALNVVFPGSCYVVLEDINMGF